MKTIVQCDFDGTITEEDMSYLMLDVFGEDDWRPLLQQYIADKISVASFNTRAFAMVKADRQTLTDFVVRRARIRDGLFPLIDYCREQDYRFVIVSNGLDFYIQAILQDIGADNIPVYAAQANFHPQGLQATYLGPDGRELDDGFKETHTRLFLGQGLRVIYIGNGLSDIPPARLAHRVFAVGDLLDYYRQHNLSCTAFTDLNDVVRHLQS